MFSGGSQFISVESILAELSDAGSPAAVFNTYQLDYPQELAAALYEMVKKSDPEYIKDFLTALKKEDRPPFISIFTSELVNQLLTFQESKKARPLYLSQEFYLEANKNGSLSNLTKDDADELSIILLDKIDSEEKLIEMLKTTYFDEEHGSQSMYSVLAFSPRVLIHFLNKIPNQAFTDMLVTSNSAEDITPSQESFTRSFFLHQAVASGDEEIFSIILKKIPQSTLKELLLEPGHNGVHLIDAIAGNLQLLLVLIQRLPHGKLDELLLHPIGKQSQTLLDVLIAQPELLRVALQKTSDNGIYRAFCLWSGQDAVDTQRIAERIDNQFFSLPPDIGRAFAHSVTHGFYGKTEKEDDPEFPLSLSGNRVRLLSVLMMLKPYSEAPLDRVAFLHECRARAFLLDVMSKKLTEHKWPKLQGYVASFIWSPNLVSVSEGNKESLPEQAWPAFELYQLIQQAKDNELNVAGWGKAEAEVRARLKGLISSQGNSRLTNQGKMMDDNAANFYYSLYDISYNWGVAAGVQSTVGGKLNNPTGVVALKNSR